MRPLFAFISLPIIPEQTNKKTELASSIMPQARNPAMQSHAEPSQLCSMAVFSYFYTRFSQNTLCP